LRTSTSKFIKSTGLKTIASSRPNATKRAERKRKRREREEDRAEREQQMHDIYAFYTV
jgi:hypothetical protein